MRALKAILLACMAGTSLFSAQNVSVSGWETYGGDALGRRYSPLTQINSNNVPRLKLAWQYGVASTAVGRSQAVPILVRGRLYTSTSGRSPCASANPGGDNGRTPARTRRRDGKTGANVR
jgi:glucose dehydrogenase